MTDLERAKEALTTIDCTCALCRDEEIRTTQLRGVAPLLSWLEEGLSGWSVADRVVGARSRMALYPAAPGDGLCPGDEPPGHGHSHPIRCSLYLR